MTCEVNRGDKRTSGLSQRRQHRGREARERREVEVMPKLTVKDQPPPRFGYL